MSNLRLTYVTPLSQLCHTLRWRFLDTPLSHYPLPISRFIHQVWGFLDFALWISRPTDNRYTTQRREQLQHPGYFKVSPDICTYKDDKKNARDALLLRTVHIYPWLAPVWPAIADVTQEAPTCLSLVFPTHSTACRSNPCPLLTISKQLNPLCWITNEIFQNWDRWW